MNEITAQREFAVSVVRKLRAAGFEAYWAGGSVRDQLLGCEPQDFDVATSARPEQVRELFGRRRTLAIGASFGVITVLGGHGLDPIEVATFRTDGVYADGRRPESVTYCDAQHDASRRDFTINGLFYDPLTEQVIDYVAGQSDLKLQIVRAIGDPRQRFTEDKLRMLRAVRFATTLDFQLDPDTQAAIGDMAEEISVVSAERIGIELRKTLLDAHRARAARLLKETGLLRQLLPELDSVDAAVYEQTAEILDRLRSPSLSAALAALLLPVRGQLSCREVARRLRLTNKEGELAEWLAGHVGQVAEAEQLPWPVMQRLLVHPGGEEMVALHEAIVGHEDSATAFCRAKLRLPPEQLNPLPLVTGDDLIAHGIRPGRHFARLLEHLRDAQLENQITDRSQALELADRWIETHGQN